MLSYSIARKILSYATNEPIDTNIHEYKEIDFTFVLYNIHFFDSFMINHSSFCYRSHFETLYQPAQTYFD